MRRFCLVGSSTKWSTSLPTKDHHLGVSQNHKTRWFPVDSSNHNPEMGSFCYKDFACFCSAMPNRKHGFQLDTSTSRLTGQRSAPPIQSPSCHEAIPMVSLDRKCTMACLEAPEGTAEVSKESDHPKWVVLPKKETQRRTRTPEETRRILRAQTRSSLLLSRG